MTESEYNITDNTRQLKYARYTTPFQEVIISDYHTQRNLPVYRSFQEVPPTDDDQTPQVFRNKDEMGQAIERVLSPEEVAEMPLKARQRQVGKYAISVNDTAEAAVSKAKNDYDRLKYKKKLSADELSDYARRRGNKVVRLIVDENTGLISDFKDGHANLLLYEGVELNTIIDYTFTPIEIQYESDDD